MIWTLFALFAAVVIGGPLGLIWWSTAGHSDYWDKT